MVDDAAMKHGREQPRVALVGAGRSRNGLGPFLATFLEEAGARVVAVVGRDRGRADHAAAELGARLGHSVGAAVALDEVRAWGADTVVIASPAETHAEFLEWAGAAGADTLCEKPLVDAAASDRLEAVLAGFARSGATLWENCQWPEMLSSYDDLVGDRAGGAAGNRRVARSVALGLSPAGRGRAMLEDSLSHLLSLVQAVAARHGTPVSGESVPQNVRLERSGDPVERVRLRFDLEPQGIEAELQLDHCPAQPRPAWLALDGRRADRSVELPSYRMFLEHGGRRQAVDDPLRTLVYGFVRHIRHPDPRLDAALRTEIHERARLYRLLLDRW